MRNQSFATIILDLFSLSFLSYSVPMGPKSRKPTKQSKKKSLQQHQTHVPSIRPTTSRTTQDILQSGLKATGLLTLAAAYSPISQLTLSPVYGSIPASIQHQWGTTVTLVLAGAVVSWVRAPILRPFICLLPVLAFSIPTIQFFLFRYSNQLGPTYGPLVTEIVTYYPLVFMSFLGSAEFSDATGLSLYWGLMLSLVIFGVTMELSISFIGRNIGSGLVFTRLGLQVVISTFYAILVPSRFLLIAVLPLLHTLFFNVHSPLPYTTAVLNSTLHEHNYSLVARQESRTGYISVLDDIKGGFRVMRCDHSLLGGEWIPQRKMPTSHLNEPIYAIFAMLEAVRLVQPQSTKINVSIPDNEKHSLVM